MLLRMSSPTPAIESAIHAFLKTFNDCNAKAYAAAFTEDGEFTNVFGQTATGRQAIEQWHAPMFSEPQAPGMPCFVNAHLTVLDTRIRLLRKDVATADIKWSQTGAIAPNGQPWGKRIGLLTLVFTQEDGAWMIATMHNTDLPLQRPS
jgi:uncharacterized protein (TIGR02246 family)